MVVKDYLDILFEGIHHQDFYTDYLFRELKKANKNHYSNQEFIKGLIDANEFLRKEIEKNNLKVGKDWTIILCKEIQ